MRRRRWRGAALFAAIFAAMALTVGLRLYGTPAVTQADVAAMSAPAAPSRAPATSPGALPEPSSSSPTPRHGRLAAHPAHAAVRKIAGAVENTPYGPLQVQVTFRGKTISAVRELVTPHESQHSTAINTQAAPLLAHEVLSSQSARIDTVSGATYTSQGYSQSVQSAIDHR
jgi:uncharacterized protein with FMN-binding domain